MKEPKRKPIVKLVGEDSNVYSIIGRVKQALKKAGADQEYIQKYMDEALSGDYNNVLVVTMDYVDVR